LITNDFSQHGLPDRGIAYVFISRKFQREAPPRAASRPKSESSARGAVTTKTIDLSSVRRSADVQKNRGTGSGDATGVKERGIDDKEVEQIVKEMKSFQG
jgi:hypothetical protein